MAYKQIKHLNLMKGSREWYLACKSHNEWRDLPRHLRLKIYRCIIAKPDACPGCGHPIAMMWNVSGKCLDDPGDYCYACRKCHKGPKPIKYPGRPKGSKNKKTIVAKEKEKVLTPWEKMCADAEKELYGSAAPLKNNI
jgi:hypothetical protein